jgi:hypothetical protein
MNNQGGDVMDKQSKMPYLLRASAVGLLVLSSSAWAGSRPSDLSGAWASDRCGDSGQKSSCGAFVLYLVQNKDRICGSYFGARQHLSQVDEGEPRSVRGVVVGNTAVVSIESGRNGAIYLGAARKSGGTLHWQVVEAIKKPSSGDVDIIAADQSMKKKAGNATAEDFVRVRQECSDG